MNKFIFYCLFFACLLVFPLIAGAQSRLSVQPESDLEQTNPPAKRSNLIQQLGLTPDQVQQLRRLNAERKSILPASRARLKSAKDAFDEALYADNYNEREIEAKLQDVHSAQMEVLRNLVTSERGIMRILTPEQRIRFRELRMQAKAANQPRLQNRNINNPGNALNPNKNLTPRQQLRLQRRINQQRRLNQ